MGTAVKLDDSAIATMSAPDALSPDGTRAAAAKTTTALGLERSGARFGDGGADAACLVWSRGDAAPERIDGRTGRRLGCLRCLPSSPTSISAQATIEKPSTSTGGNAAVGKTPNSTAIASDENRGDSGASEQQDSAAPDDDVASISRRSLFRLYLRALSNEDSSSRNLPSTYGAAKHSGSSLAYRRARGLLLQSTDFREWCLSDPGLDDWTLCV